MNCFTQSILNIFRAIKRIPASEFSILYKTKCKIPTNNQGRIKAMVGPGKRMNLGPFHVTFFEEQTILPAAVQKLYILLK
jgi:hypothetical protein